MKKSSWIQVVLAAVLVLVAGGLALAAEPQIMKVKVKKGDTETVEVDHNGTVEVLTLDDLADGEERSYQAGDHEITVRREGDSLTVEMDGESFGTTIHQGSKNMVWVAENGEAEGKIDIVTEAGMHAKKVMILSDAGDAGDAKVIKIHCEGAEDCDDIETINIETMIDGEIDIEALKQKLGEEHVMVHVGEGGHGGPMIIKTAVAAEDKVVYRCAEDGAEIVLKKADATQEHYTCPVCGRLMEKVEHPQVKVIELKHEIEQDTAD
jgi:hypothetical protein